MLTLMTLMALATGNSTDRSFLEAPPHLEMLEEIEAPAPEPALPARILGDPKFSIGLTFSYLTLKDADTGAWFYGIHARVYFLPLIAVEALVGTSKSDFEDGDGSATIVPVQLTALIMPFEGLPIRPYGLLGVGWYYQDVKYSGSLSGLDNETDSSFGFHLGFGTELKVGPVMLHLDFRYVFMQDPNLQVDANDFNFWTINFGVALTF